MSHAGIVLAQPFSNGLGNDDGLLSVTTTKNALYAGDMASMLVFPLMQFKSGISAEDVQCNQGLQIIIKVEDNSPACVTSQTAQKLIERGWGMISNLTFTNNNPKNNCGRFYTAPANQDDFKSIPVLLMNSNSTACAKLTFTIVSDYKDCNGKTCQAVSRLDSIIHIGDGLNVTPERDYTNSFKITAIPETIDLANYPIDSNFTVLYIIHSLPNATGFYDQSLPKPICEHYPLAVGYSGDEVNASDFSFLLYHPTCASGEYQLTGVEISGMNYKQVVLP